MKKINIKVKQIILNVRFNCEIQAYFKHENIIYPIDQHIKLNNGKVSEVKQFQIDFQTQNLKVFSQNNLTYMIIYLKSNSGKLKIMNKEIRFQELTEGQNHFSQKFDNCPDKNATITYSLFCQKLLIPLIKDQPISDSIEIKDSISVKELVQQNKKSETYFSTLPRENTKDRIYTPAPFRSNHYTEENLFSTQRYNNFVNSLQKKSTKKYQEQINIPKSIERKFGPSSIRLYRYESKSSDKQKYSSTLKQKLIQAQQKTYQQLRIQKSKIKQLNKQLQDQTHKLFKSQQNFKLIEQKYKKLQKQLQKVSHENRTLKLVNQRVQQKLCQIKQKYQSLTLSNQNSINRFNAKQTQYREQMKNLTQKIATSQFQKQKITFEIQTIKSQKLRDQQNYEIQIKKYKLKQQEDIQSFKKSQNSLLQQIKQIQTQNLALRNELTSLDQRNLSLINEIKMKSLLEQKLRDQISKLKLQCEDANSKLLLFTQSLLAEKSINGQFQNLKLQYMSKLQLMSKMESDLKSSKSKILQSQKNFQSQKQINNKQLAVIDGLNQRIVMQQSNIKQLSQTIQSLSMTIKAKYSQNQLLSSNIAQLKQQQRLLQAETKQNILQLQTNIATKNIEIQKITSQLKNKTKQINNKTLEITLLNKNIAIKQNLMEQISQVIQRYQNKFLSSNSKLYQLTDSNKGISASQNSNQSNSKLQTNTIPIMSEISSRLYQNDKDLLLRIKKLNSNIFFKIEKLIHNLEQVTDQKANLQRDINALSSSLERLHGQTLEQHNSLLGTKSSLQDKLTTNQRLMNRMKLIIEQKTTQIQTFNKKLKELTQKYQETCSVKQNLQNQLTSAKINIQTLQNQLTKVTQQKQTQQNSNQEVQKQQSQQIKRLETKIDTIKVQNAKLMKIKSLQCQQLKSNLNNINKINNQLKKQSKDLQQALTANKAQILKTNTAFSDVYKHVNNVQKQSKIASFYFIPLRQAIKKLQTQINPKNNLMIASIKLQKQATSTTKSNTIKIPPQPPTLQKSPQSKISVNSKNSLQKKQRIKSKQSLKG